MEHLHSSPAVCLAAAVPVFATHWLVLPSFTWLKPGAAGHSPAVCGPLLLEYNYLNVFSPYVFPKNEGLFPLPGRFLWPGQVQLRSAVDVCFANCLWRVTHRKLPWRGEQLAFAGAEEAFGVQRLCQGHRASGNHLLPLPSPERTMLGQSSTVTAALTKL